MNYMNYHESLDIELNQKYVGRKVKEDCTDYLSLESDDVLAEENITLDVDDVECNERMSIQIELDDNKCIEKIWVSFHTSCWGDSGLGEVDPSYIWTYGECYNAAAKFIENILE